MLNGTGRLKPRHLLVLVVPALGTTPVLCLWSILRLLGWFVPQADAEITTNAWLPTLGAIFGITAAVILNRVIEEDIRMHQCVEANDLKALKGELKKRIHPLIHILMGVMTLFIIGGLITLPYEAAWSGVKDIGSLTFAMLLYWNIALVLDNPLQAPWIRDVIPPEMRKELEEAGAESC